ncbi:hypothetical protein IFM61606_04432 [Aspergillus udagawae]|uniref:CST complex subunit Ten1 n=1 Tax=Aspergillus udagawae TaxID=91492 RepID=A0A8E0V3Q8_9EURO|nr:uncharacterized protein Aud_010371 [Aspergillus udagawae]GFF29546.1 hypothetical protein IFM51744_00869 [Aspergillus udagawae]GFF47742.1 hypothetical protein IFM46972_08373 [Aspergillus udagawae]GFG12019.1 hypothetical protein IFM5058_05737 [Aspergillus udagawae]GFG24520.1 hypothetical protein IFM61606_04432 [Aspergillus udagawae]GIC93883.1 hypothetical protein Aud_010371 [Aspergillus udagawae]
MNGPLPSTRAFLSDLPSLPPGSKVRFLGCVRTYHIASGHLILEHDYPRRRFSSNAGTEPACVAVDVNAVLEAVTVEELRVGAWVNVVGYVRRWGSDCNDHDILLRKLRLSSPVYVEAVMVFSAGVVELGEYERVLREALEVERRILRPD